MDQAKQGLVLLPQHWAARFWHLARDDERLSETLTELPFVVFAIPMLVKAAPLLQSA